MTNPRYWDCECDGSYIHKKSDQPDCSDCGTTHEEMPDSMSVEVQAIIEDDDAYAAPYNSPERRTLCHLGNGQQ